MVKITRARLGSFLQTPDPAINLVLVFGPDRGLVREYSDKLVQSVVADPRDPFLVSVLSASDLKEDPSRLADEAAAISMVGGRRVVVLRSDGSDVSRPVMSLMDAPVGDALVVVEAGSLTAKSALRKAAEASSSVAVISAYADEEGSLQQLIDEVFNPRKIRPAAAAREYLLHNLGGDRLTTRNELEKVALFAGDGQDLSLEDVMAAVGDSAALSMDDIVYAAASGNLAEVDRLLVRATADSLSPIALLRSGQRHFQRLQLVVGEMENGKPAQAAMKSLRPPVIFTHADRFRGQLRQWSLSKIAVALDLLVEAELECKTTGMPADEACGRALMRIAHAAGRPR